MTEQSSPHYVAIGQLMTCDPQDLFCPICGKRMIQAEENLTTVDPCPHIAFFYLPEYEAFEYQSEDFEERTKDLEFEYDEDDYIMFEEYLAAAGYGNSLLTLELTYGGVACGPVSITIVVGYDYESIAR